MAIDRIGKGGAPPPTPETQGTGGVEKKGSVEKSFQAELHKGEATKHAGAVDAAHGVSPLARLRAGEVDVNGYLDLKVDEATRSLPHGLSPHEIDEIKKVLRDQMATDPGLVDLVRSATGQMPKPPED
jgi:hypothetical protein